MKKILYFLAAAVCVTAFTACDDDDNYSDVWNDYAANREAGEKWIAEQEALTDEDGNPFYTRLVPSWNPDEYILIHWFNDRTETAGNLRPDLTSTFTAKYNGYLCDGTLFDTSEDANDEGTYTAQVTAVIEGWQIALQNMNCGDTVQIVIPYAQAYGSQSSGEIKPYSALRFNLRLVDLPYYQIKP